MIMSKADSNFDAWLTKGLQTPITTETNFPQKILMQLRQQEAARALKRIQLQKRIWAASIWAVVLVGISVFVIFGAGTGIYTFLQDLLGGLVAFILEPSASGLLIPGIVLSLAVVVLWNAIEMVSQE